jgi:mRNA interferase RelE/StbE
LPFEIRIAPAADKFLKKAENTLRTRIIEKLRKLAEDPFPPDSKRVIGREEKVYRVRVGDYRILYIAYLENNQIAVINIDKRSSVYR